MRLGITRKLNEFSGYVIVFYLGEYRGNGDVRLDIDDDWK